MICLCACLSLSLCVPFALVLLMSLPCPPLPLSVMSLCVIPLIVLVSPSLYLHSRSRLSASSSSSSWLPPEAQDPLLCCWAPGPQPLQARAREAWSSKASSELAVVLTCWSVCYILTSTPILDHFAIQMYRILVFLFDECYEIEV